MFMTDPHLAVLSEPGFGALRDPSPFVASHLASVFIGPPSVAFSVRCHHFDGSLLQPLAMRIGVVCSIGDHPLWPLPRLAFEVRGAGFLECGFRERNFYRGGTFRKNSWRKKLNN